MIYRIYDSCISVEAKKQDFYTAIQHDISIASFYAAFSLMCPCDKWLHRTGKPVCNDHLYEIYYLWFI